MLRQQSRQSQSQHRKLNLRQLLLDQGIAFSEGRDDWLNLRCPHCGDREHHLGWSGTVFSCFKCGKHGRLETIQKLLDKSIPETIRIMSKHEGDRSTRGGVSNRSGSLPAARNRLEMPYGAEPMKARHREYLSKRGFDPEKLERQWGLLGTGHLGDFKHRVIIPIWQNGKLVCYQGRDITGQSKSKYLSCPDDLAAVPIKNCLYGLDECPDRSFVAITEGVTKVWRLGPGSVATFGVVVTARQLMSLRQFKRRAILFDRDEAGESGAEHLARELSVLGGETEVVHLDGVDDVGELTDGEGQLVMEGLRK